MGRKIICEGDGLCHPKGDCSRCTMDGFKFQYYADGTNNVCVIPSPLTCAADSGRRFCSSDEPGKVGEGGYRRSDCADRWDCTKCVSHTGLATKGIDAGNNTCVVATPAVCKADRDRVFCRTTKACHADCSIVPDPHELKTLTAQSRWWWKHMRFDFQ